MDDPRDVLVDVSGDQSRAVSPGVLPYVAGARIEVHVPFEGDQSVFGFAANTFTTTLPRADIVRNEVIVTVKSARKALGEHPHFATWKEAADETEMRAAVRWPGDEERLADLNVFLVHIPAEGSKAA